MSTRTRVLKAAALTAAIALQVHRDRAHRTAERQHEGDLEVHQVEIDRLNAHCDITDDVKPSRKVILPAEQSASDREFVRLAAKNWTRAEISQITATIKVYEDQS